MRCLSWSHRFLRWQGLGEHERGKFWSDFTLYEAQHQIRTRELIKILKDGKSTGNGVILFVQRVFLVEMCIRASHTLRVQLLTEDMRINGLEIWVYRREGCTVVREEV